MKSIKSVCVVLGLSLVSLVPAMAGVPISVNVPYPFVAGKVKLPAGSYTIQEDAMNGVVTIRSSDGRSVVLMSGPGVRTSDNVPPSLTFVNVRGQMVLSSIQPEADASRVLPVRGLMQ